MARAATLIAGIGSSIPFDNVHHELYDAVHRIDLRHAMARAIARDRAADGAQSAIQVPP